MISRRRFLATTALATPAVATAALAGAGLGLASSQARAFSLEEPADGIANLYHEARACSLNGYHEQLLADVRTQLDGQDLPEETKAQATAAALCPLCGCPLAS